jgi:hypothetical protein
MINSTTEVTPPQHFICPISCDLMTDPLVSIYGHHYQREAILGWLSEGNDTCPLTRNPLLMRMLVSDGRLQSDINKWMLENGLAVRHKTEPKEDPARRVVGLGCIFTPSKRQLRTLIMMKTESQSQRRAHRFLHPRQRRIPSASRFV